MDDSGPSRCGEQLGAKAQSPRPQPGSDQLQASPSERARYRSRPRRDGPEDARTACRCLRVYYQLAVWERKIRNKGLAVSPTVEVGLAIAQNDSCQAAECP